MTNVVLKATPGSGTPVLYKYTIKEQTYRYGHLFKRYEHKPQDDSVTGPFYICKDFESASNKKATYSFHGQYSKASLDKAHVYYSIADDKHNNPLILVLFFKGIPKPRDRYYKRSVFEQEIPNNVNKDLGNLDEYVSEKNLLDVLLNEIDTVPDILSYDINNMIVENYNNKKINVTNDEVKGPTDQTTGFNKYTHQPSGSGGKNKACVLYKKKFLYRWNAYSYPGKAVQISELQGITIHNMVVYYSVKINVPLMICFHKEERSRQEHIYYFLKVHKDFYWEKMDRNSYSHVVRQQLGNNEIHTKLTDKRNELLISALRNLEYDLTQILVIIVDKTNGYSNSEVTNTFQAALYDMEHLRIVNNLGKVTVKMSTECNTLENIGYKLYEHDINAISKSFQSGEPLRLSFIRSDDESIGQDSDFLTIDLDYQPENGSYRSQERLIQVSNAYSPIHNYKWYKHGCEHEIFGRTFRIRFDGQYVTLDGDPNSSPKLVIVYFLNNFFDRFILIAFSDEPSKKIWYMTYTKFREFVLNRSTVKLSKLVQMNADTKTTNMDGGVGYVIDRPILKILQEEYNKLRADINSTVDHLYYHVGQDKLYVYLSNDSRALMICYNNKAYTRYFLGKKSSRWKLVDGINSCICKNNLGVQDSSYDNLVKSLNVLADNFRLIRPHGLSDLEETEKSFTIDISMDGPSVYNFGKVSVKSAAVYENCNIFRYYSHTHSKEDTFNISSLTMGNSQGKTRKFKEQITDVKSANVYFLMNTTKKPIILEIVLRDGTKKYYKDLDKGGEPVTIAESIDITSINLADKLIEESELINGTVIYQIDKTPSDSNSVFNYGPGNSIKISKDSKTNSGFTLYTHTTGSSSKKSFILFQKKQLVGKSKPKPEELKGVQDKPYSYIKVFSFDNDRSFPLFVELKDSKQSNYYSHKNNENGTYWEKESSGIDDEDYAKEKLDALYYHLKCSVIIEIDTGLITTHTRGLTYPIKLIDNKKNGPGISIEANYNSLKKLGSNKNITVSEYSKISDTKSMQYSSFYYVKHEIKVSNLTTDDKKDIGGFRLFISQIALGGPLELKLYDSNTHGNLQESNRVYLYYTFRERQESIIYVYYHGKDAIPLAVCYKSKVYKPKDNKGTEWVCAKEASCFDQAKVFHVIQTAYQSTRKKFILVDRGNDENIKPSTHNVGKSSGTFSKCIYEPDKQKNPSGPYKLPITTLIKGITNNTLEKLLNTLNNQRFDKVTKYTSGSKPLLFEFVRDATKITFVRIDEHKYWLNETIENPEIQLESIDSNVRQTNVYEVDDTTTKYNDNITSDHKMDQPTKGFNKYIHTPKNKKLNKSLFLYNGVKLMKKGDKGSPEELDEINDTSYDNVAVYFGTKAKSKTNFQPLILELNKTRPNPKTHYRLRLKDSSYYWEKVTIPSQGLGDKQLINKLKETEFDLVESVVILMDRRMPTYGNSEIVKAVSSLSRPKEINLANIGGKMIKANDVTYTGAKWVGDNGYRLYEYNLSSCLEQGKNYAIRFFIFADNSSETYKEINLYGNDEDLDTLYCNSSGGNEIKVYVYYYGDQDPRPLLLCFNGDAYKAKDKEGYLESWYKIANIKKCQCQDDSDNPCVMDCLTDLVKFLNVVQLHTRPIIRFREDEKPNTPGKEVETYCVQKYMGKDIEITVGYQNKTCYRLYTHKPYGSFGTGHKYRLGNINYDSDGPNRNGLDYKSPKPLSSVSVYYSVYDENHDNPLLVALEFKTNDGNTHEYYRLEQKKGKKWKKFEDSGEYGDILKKIQNPYKIEDGLYDLKNKLGIELKDDDKKKITPLFNPEKCTEGNLDVAAIAGGTTGAAAVVGTGITVGIIVAKKLGAAAVTTFVAAAVS